MDIHTPTEKEAFDAFITERLGGDLNGLSLEAALARFRAYQRDLAQFKADTQDALEGSARGESKPLDIEEVVARGRARLAEKGITD